MFYVYLIQSLFFPDQKYIGYTVNLEERLRIHNKGGSRHTAKYKPWGLVMYLTFADHDSALAFEKYLKTGSGQAFAQKRLWK
jgi:predicted GIY-YIG superfamily endonuclease